MSPGGSESLVYSFNGILDGANDGENPVAGRIADKAGNVYGTTRFGGQTCQSPGCGIVFRIARDGTETVLHFFADNDGANPAAGLPAGKDGYLYGTTQFGGEGNCKSGCGAVFPIKK
jgi:uncharacterized repeat protein (TIGR03803 family)